MTFQYVVDNLRAAGAQKVLLTIVRALDPASVRARVWVLGAADDLDEAFRDAGAEVVRFPKWALLTGAALPGMKRALRQAPVVLMHSFLWHADQLTRWLGPSAGVPAVVASVRAVDRGKPAWRRRVDRLLAARADLTIAVSRSALEHAIEHEGVPAERAAVVHNGVDASRYDPEQAVDPREFVGGLPEGARVIGIVGRLHPQKGHRFLFDAVRTLRTNRPEVHVFVIGEGPLGDTLKRQATERGMRDAVHFLGRRGDVPRLLAALDIFCLPSLYEGMPNALLEAMAMARPCVASAVEGSCDVIEEGTSGLLVPPADANALADALRRLLADPQRAAAMGAAARRRVERAFSVERMLRGYDACYRDLLNRTLPDGWDGPIFREDTLTP